MQRRSLLAILLLLFAVQAQADFAAYSGIHEVTARKGTLTFRHVHNWNSPKLQPLFADLNHHETFFSPANDFAHVEVRDGNRVLFRSPSPGLTHLWISPDGQFFVGLSTIMLYNPYQLVVWQRDGTVLYRQHISHEVARLTPEQQRSFAKKFPKAEKFLSARYFTYGNGVYLDYSILGVPNEIGTRAWDYLTPFRVSHPYSDDFSESVTNYVGWFHEKSPRPGITRDDTGLTLSLRSPTGRQMTIPIQRFQPAEFTDRTDIDPFYFAAGLCVTGADMGYIKPPQCDSFFREGGDQRPAEMLISAAHAWSRNTASPDTTQHYYEPDGKRLVVKHAALSQALSEFYVQPDRFTKAEWEERQKYPRGESRLTMDDLLGLDRRKRLSFVAGIYARCHDPEDGSFHGFPSVAMYATMKILRAEGCDVPNHTLHKAVPTTIHFKVTPSREVAHLFKAVDNWQPPSVEWKQRFRLRLGLGR
ncbi:hypothetical protein DES53_11690 [Roseimicrobium gellanilyticum]|uniref:Uncharacterized protein n=1 Tax=Roseimicrobium gellanilyticum TaxID=748857 RepID=A0A366H3T1_9BACT|nr:hypothetical protein [Roseimicrobium gellanilyticum]RBP36651.1 hypothetical protein DES53_11690 [Roseimicrobium gellanilyticum]